MKIRYARGAFKPEDVVKFLTFTGRSRTVFPGIVRTIEVWKKAEEFGLEVSAGDLQAYADHYRISHKLYTRQDALAFLAARGLTEDDLVLYCETALLVDKIKDRLATEAKVLEYFVNNRTEFELARLSVIDVPSESLAREILVQATDEGSDFHVLARQHSVDASTRYGGGSLGFVVRKDLPPELGLKVFAAAPGSVVGPFAGEGTWRLVLVEEIIKAEINAPVQALIRERLFEEWEAQIIKGDFEVVPD
jgi:parvulin-like peptidyl-prolyl isomerase